MRGSVIGQVNYLWQYSGLNRIGESKHAAKDAARAMGARTWHDIGKSIGVHSYSTKGAYQDVWKQSFAYAKQNFGVRDLEKLEGRHIHSFLQSKLDAGRANSTIRQYCAAHEKLERALNNYAQEKGSGKTYDFSRELKEIRNAANQSAPRFNGSRAYKDPDRLVQNIHDDRFRTIASVQRESGARLHEVRFDGGNLRGIQGEKGVLSVKGKGGKIREIRVERSTYQKIEKEVNKLQPGQKWGVGNKVDRNTYRDSLKEAARATGQEYHGSHGLRWNYAQDRHREVQQEGKTYLESLPQVSQEMGHERGDITEHYLQ